MELRNKKTGEIGHLLTTKGLHRYDIIDDDYRLLASYNSLAEVIKEWEEYESVEPLIKDEKTKEAFIEHLDKHKDERFFQAVRNFAKEYLGDDFKFIYSCERPIDTVDRCYDTFYLVCDELHEIRKENECRKHEKDTA